MGRSKASARLFVIGIASIAVMAVVGSVAITANQGRLPGTPVTVVRAAFNDVGQLQPGSDVRQNGVSVGQVSSIRLIDGHPVVTMDIHGGVPMYRDGYAGIWDQSALAQKLVELRSGNPASGLLGDAVLPVSHTESTHDVVDLLDVFDPPTRAALGNMLRQLGGGLAGYGPGLHDFVATAPSDLADVGTISSTLASPHTDLPGFLQVGDRLSNRFTGQQQQQITELLAQTDQTLRALATETGAPLGATVSKLPASLRALRGAMDDSYQPLLDLAAATEQLHTGSHALGEATPDVRGVFREALEPLGQIPDVATDADPAVDDLRHTFQDARPFLPKLAEGLSSAAPPLRVLTPYSRDTGTLFNDLGTLLSSHDGWEYRLRIFPVSPNTSSVLGDVIADSKDPYPTPGQSTRDRDTNGGLFPGDPGR
jgi:phospholipid/cholesterol/gamma-HCH transport system substrate-binding protein